MRKTRVAGGPEGSHSLPGMSRKTMLRRGHGSWASVAACNLGGCGERTHPGAGMHKAAPCNIRKGASDREKVLEH